jgi:isoquinoline 1-oxidoreductase alpha subunit
MLEPGMVMLSVNGESHQVDVEEEMPLLWVLREELGMRGTKFGCGIAQCGACTVHVDGQAVRSCVYPVAAAKGKDIRTIESLDNGESTHQLQQAWIKHQVPQCGYCQSGMQMAALALLQQNAAPSDSDIDKAMTNICRCGSYDAVRAAIKDAAGSV